MTGERRTIVCLSSQPWHDRMWTNKHHVMKRLAEQHRVIFVNYGESSPLAFLRRARQNGAGERFGLLDLWRRPSVRRVPEGLEVLDVWTPPLPARFHGTALRIRPDFARRLRLLKRWLLEQGILDAIIWVYHPGYGDWVKELPHRAIVYDCVDEYSAFPEFKTAKAWIAEQERRLCAAAAVVTCTAPALYETKQSLAPGRTHLVHNVGDAVHFAQAMAPATRVPDDIGQLPRPIVGFIGAVSDYKLNLEWMLELARRKPSWTLAIVGPWGISDPNTDLSRLKALPNVRLLGHRGYAELPGYLKGFDVAVIPYRINDYTRAVFPIKFFEFLASGRPVVISDLPAVEAYWSAVRVARDADEFVAACEAAVQEGTALAEGDAAARAAQQRRLELAGQNTWSERVRKLLGHVEAALASG